MGRADSGASSFALRALGLAALSPQLAPQSPNCPPPRRLTSGRSTSTAAAWKAASQHRVEASQSKTEPEQQQPTPTHATHEALDKADPPQPLHVLISEPTIPDTPGSCPEAHGTARQHAPEEEGQALLLGTHAPDEAPPPTPPPELQQHGSKHGHASSTDPHPPPPSPQRSELARTPAAGRAASARPPALHRPAAAPARPARPLLHVTVGSPKPGGAAQAGPAAAHSTSSPPSSARARPWTASATSTPSRTWAPRHAADNPRAATPAGAAAASLANASSWGSRAGKDGGPSAAGGSLPPQRSPCGKPASPAYAPSSAATSPKHPTPSGGIGSSVASSQARHMQSLLRRMHARGGGGRRHRRPNNSLPMGELLELGNDVAEYWSMRKHYNPNHLMVKEKERKLLGKLRRTNLAEEAMSHGAQPGHGAGGKARRKICIPLNELLGMESLLPAEWTTDKFIKLLRKSETVTSTRQRLSMLSKLLGRGGPEPEPLPGPGRPRAQIRKVRSRKPGVRLASSLSRGRSSSSRGIEFFFRSSSLVKDSLVQHWEELRGRSGARELMDKARGAGEEGQYAVTALKLFLRDHRERLGWSIGDLEENRRQALLRQQAEGAEEEGVDDGAAAAAAAAQPGPAASTPTKAAPPVSLAQAACGAQEADPAVLAAQAAERDADAVAGEQREALAANSSGHKPPHSPERQGARLGIAHLITCKVDARTAQGMHQWEIPASPAREANRQLQQAGHKPAASSPQAPSPTAASQGTDGMQQGARRAEAEPAGRAERRQSFARNLTLLLEEESGSDGVEGDGGMRSAPAAAGGGEFGSRPGSCMAAPATPLAMRISSLWANAPTTVQHLLPQEQAAPASPGYQQLILSRRMSAFGQEALGGSAAAAAAGLRRSASRRSQGQAESGDPGESANPAAVSLLQNFDDSGESAMRAAAASAAAARGTGGSPSFRRSDSHGSPLSPWPHPGSPAHGSRMGRGSPDLRARLAGAQPFSPEKDPARRLQLQHVSSPAAKGAAVSWVAEAATTERRLLKQSLEGQAKLPVHVLASLADVQGEEDWMWEDVHSPWMPSPSEIREEVLLREQGPKAQRPPSATAAHAASRVLVARQDAQAGASWPDPAAPWIPAAESSGRSSNEPLQQQHLSVRTSRGGALPPPPPPQQQQLPQRPASSGQQPQADAGSCRDAACREPGDQGQETKVALQHLQLLVAKRQQQQQQQQQQQARHAQGSTARRSSSAMHRAGARDHLAAAGDAAVARASTSAAMWSLGGDERSGAGGLPRPSRDSHDGALLLAGSSAGPDPASGTEAAAASCRPEASMQALDLSSTPSSALLQLFFGSPPSSPRCLSASPPDPGAHPRPPAAAATAARQLLGGPAPLLPASYPDCGLVTYTPLFPAGARQLLQRPTLRCSSVSSLWSSRGSRSRPRAPSAGVSRTAYLTPSTDSSSSVSNSPRLHLPADAAGGLTAPGPPGSVSAPAASQRFQLQAEAAAAAPAPAAQSLGMSTNLHQLLRPQGSGRASLAPPSGRGVDRPASALPRTGQGQTGMGGKLQGTSAPRLGSAHHLSRHAAGSSNAAAAAASAWPLARQSHGFEAEEAAPPAVRARVMPAGSHNNAAWAQETGMPAAAGTSASTLAAWSVSSTAPDNPIRSSVDSCESCDHSNAPGSDSCAVNGHLTNHGMLQEPSPRVSLY